ncbi:CxC2 domain-containing protein [Mycena chlorophos]|uniref:CxC2 domain-containing protein n=1 Tax=Mycena chlorophos TaxID=658473 RepID=A0A8H6RWF2_MYCCL|nr:CxC2 domain-containing protein [Mycena chlorophos]
MDACFQLKRRLVSSDARDPALGPGYAFMLDSKAYREYLRTSKYKQEMSTCSGLKAVDHANTRFSKGYAATGVGMVVCARHELVLPTGVGDLQKGERYANMDYIFASMLRHFHQMLRKIVSYDIACQWYKKILNALNNSPPFLKAVLLRQFTRFVVPGYIFSATPLHLNLVPGSGQDGRWGSSGPGLRLAAFREHEDDGPGSGRTCWKRTGRTGTGQRFLVFVTSTLRQQLDAAKVELAKQVEAFDLFSEEQEELVPEWTDMVLAHEADSSKKNPYVAEFKGETEAQVRLRLQTLKTSKLRRAALLCAFKTSARLDSWSSRSQSSYNSTNKNIMSWIWRGTKARGSEAAMLEAIRIEWCKAWARVRRWDEEVLMLTDEMRRVAVTHEEWACRWDERAKSVPVGSVPEQEAEGMLAYALKQAAMHRRLAVHARTIATEPRLAKGRRRVRWVQAPVVLIGEGMGSRQRRKVQEKTQGI